MTRADLPTADILVTDARRMQVHDLLAQLRHEQRAKERQAAQEKELAERRAWLTEGRY